MSFKFAVLLGVFLNSSCFTIEKSELTEDGQVIPGRQFLQFRQYEYLCAPTFSRDHTKLEELLDRYGRKGWRLGGFVQRGGDSVAYCLYR